ncbi:MAG: hypothetical protein ACYS9X_07035 [Planctomycetota bacterium]|jgi:hypothetical protein
MQGRDFYEKVTSRDGMEWLGVREGRSPGEDEALVRHTKTGVKHAVAVSSILEHSWQELEAVLTGRREARVMIHLTRIVGYYSRVQNWNRSKLAELKDRHEGVYAVPDKAAPAARAPAPAELAAVA